MSVAAAPTHWLLTRLVIASQGIPHDSIGTDIMSASGESDWDLRIARYLPNLHSPHNVFSTRTPGHCAAELPAVQFDFVRDSAGVVRAIGRELNQRFHRAQEGSVRPGLTIEDGSLVVTDNYLKVRIPSGLPRNEWVTVAITGDGDALVGAVVSSREPEPEPGT